MDQFECTEIIDNIEKADLKANTVYIFGLNPYCSFILGELKKRNIAVTNILDNNAGKQGKVFEGVPVEAPEKCLKNFDDGVRVLIASKYYDEMCRQLKGYGYGRKHICQLLHLWDNGHFSHKTFMEYLALPVRGKQIIDDIRNRYGEEAWILYAPVISVGDVYLMSLYIHSFLKGKKAECVFLLTGNAAGGLAGSLGLRNVEVLNKKESFTVMNFLMLNGFEKNHVLLLHTGYAHTSISERLLTYKGYTWLDNYRIIFGLKKDTWKSVPSFLYDKERLKHILLENEIETKETVILSPYTNTVPEIEKTFWSGLSERLVSAGFQVFTNVAGAEEPIPGTKPLTFALEYAEAIMDKAAGFIGLRNGLCDIVSNSCCRKVILYPEMNCDFLSVYDYYSFGKMGIGRNLEEIIFRYDDIGQGLMGRVSDCLKGR